MARCLISGCGRIRTCALALLVLSGCGGRTAEIEEDDWPIAGGWSLGGATAGASTSGGSSSGGTISKGGTTNRGGTGPNWTGGVTGLGGWATGGYYPTGGWTTGGIRATGGYAAMGGKATGGIGGKGGMGGYGGVAGKAPTSGSAGWLRGGAGGIGGYGGVAGKAGAGGQGGTSGASGGPSAGSAGCPSTLSCTTNCPVGRWPSIEGCLTCACMPPDKLLKLETLSCAGEALTVSVVPLRQTGTWVFNFSWACAGGALAPGLPMSASLSATILDTTTSQITSTNRTLVYSSFSSVFTVVFSQAQVVAVGSGVPLITVPLGAADGSYLSIRREGDYFVGGVYFSGIPSTSSSGTSTALLAGSFKVAVPL